jgi:Domain of unknown function (DUF5658)
MQRAKAHVTRNEGDSTPGQHSRPHTQRVITAAMIVFIALQCMDLLTTLAAFSQGGVELNPIVRSLMPWTGRGVAVLVSKAIVISLVLLLNRRNRILRFANVLYAMVVAWNVATVLKLVATTA